MNDAYVALLNTMVDIILKTPWEMREAPMDVGMGGLYTECRFCGCHQRAKFSASAWGVNHYDLTNEHLGVQEELENPDNHVPDCLWRLAKEYRR